MATRKEQHIEQVASIIYENDVDEADARRINDRTGWGFDVRYDDGEYVSENNFTRVREFSLSPEALETALQMAERWRRGEFDA